MNQFERTFKKILFATAQQNLTNKKIYVYPKEFEEFQKKKMR